MRHSLTADTAYTALLSGCAYKNMDDTFQSAAVSLSILPDESIGRNELDSRTQFIIVDSAV